MLGTNPVRLSKTKVPKPVRLSKTKVPKEYPKPTRAGE